MVLGNLPGAFASLSSGLLARKGAAKPAMRPQGFGQMGASLEDLGWNDMGFEAPKPTVSLQDRDADHDAFGDAVAEQPLRNPVAALTRSPVHGQQVELAQRLAEASDAGEPEDAGDYDEAGGQETVAEPDARPPVLRPPMMQAAPPVLVAAPIEEPPAFLPQAAVISIKPRLPEQSTPTTSLAHRAPVASAPVPRAPTTRAPAASASAVREGTGSSAKAAFTLRLEAPRHLRLRLACALTGRSAQMLVIDAVDKLLADYPELDTIAQSLPGGGTSRRAKG